MDQHDWNPPQHDEVREHTSTANNQRIDRTTRGAIDEASTSRTALRARLAELDREWTLDRALMLNFSILGGLSASLAMRNLRRTGKLGAWGALFITQMAFLAHHAIRRWCPPMPVFRRLGFRSDQEIDAERELLRQRLSDRFATAVE
ncbi:MAG TPA: hypothetical protein VFQ53_12470 [Kofleriaceae bacterium]|nr:hypothetical protein [Kofleriaceae bacterium]